MGSRGETGSGTGPRSRRAPMPDVPPLEPQEPERKGGAHARGGLQLVLIRWRDAWFDVDQPPGGWREDYLVQTVGFLVRDTPEVVSVAQELLPGRDGFRAVTHIPRGVIESVTTLFQEEGPARRAGDHVLQRHP